MNAERPIRQAQPRRRRCPACHRLSVSLDESEVHVCPDHGRFSERIWQEFNTGRRASRLPRSVDALIEVRAEQALVEIMALALWHRWCLTHCNPLPGRAPPVVRPLHQPLTTEATTHD